MTETKTDKMADNVGALVLALLLILIATVIPSFVGGWLLMLLLGILNLNVAIGVPALGYFTSVAIYYLSGVVLGLKTVGRKAVEEVSKKTS